MPQCCHSTRLGPLLYGYMLPSGDKASAITKLQPDLRESYSKGGGSGSRTIAQKHKLHHLRADNRLSLSLSLSLPRRGLKPYVYLELIPLTEDNCISRRGGWWPPTDTPERMSRSHACPDGGLGLGWGVGKRAAEAAEGCVFHLLFAWNSPASRRAGGGGGGEEKDYFLI